MKKVIIIILVILVAAGITTWVLVRRNEYKPPVWKTARVEKGSVTVNVTSTGSLSAVTTVQVGAQVSGIVAKMFVDFDSVVKKGQLIAILDTTLLYASMKDAAAAVEKARVQVELTRRQYIRTDTLFHEKVAAQADYDLAYSNFMAAQADLKAAIATLEHEKVNLRYATIKAPIGGTVISRNVDVGQTVISSFNAVTLFTIAKDLTQMQVLANVDEADIGQVKDGQETVFTVDAYPYEVFKGKVAQIRLQPVLVQNVNNYTVVINVYNPDLKLLPGLTANITIKVLEHTDVLRIPSNAIHFIPPADYIDYINFPDSMAKKLMALKVAGNEIPKPNTACYVWVKRGEAIQPVLVTVGIFDGSNIEISGDIKEGDEVITGTGPAKVTEAATNNPFMPKMPGKRTTR